MLARGGALTPPGATPHAATRFRPRAFAAMLAAAVCLVVVDHLTKWWVVSALPLYAQWPSGSAVSIHHVVNRGAAFSLLPGAQWVFLVVAVVVCGYIVVAGHRFGNSVYRQVVLGAVLGGALSNAVDRLSQGYVVDFVDVHIWPVWNVADMAIVCGILLAVVTFREPGGAGTPA